jgi:hypothetical protein
MVKCYKYGNYRDAIIRNRRDTQKSKSNDCNFTSKAALNSERDGSISHGPESKIESDFYVLHLDAIRVLLVGLCLSLMVSRSAEATPPGGYKLVFADEFNGPLEVASVTGWGLPN